MRLSLTRHAALRPGPAPPPPLHASLAAEVAELARRFEEDIDYAVLNFRLYGSRDPMLAITRHRWRSHPLDALLSLPSSLLDAADTFFHELDRVATWATVVDDMPETLRGRLERANARVQAAANKVQEVAAALASVSQADTTSG